MLLLCFPCCLPAVIYVFTWLGFRSHILTLFSGYFRSSSLFFQPVGFWTHSAASTWLVSKRLLRCWAAQSQTLHLRSLCNSFWGFFFFFIVANEVFLIFTHKVTISHHSLVIALRRTVDSPLPCCDQSLVPSSSQTCVGHAARSSPVPPYCWKEGVFPRVILIYSFTEPAHCCSRWAMEL